MVTSRRNLMAGLAVAACITAAAVGTSAAQLPCIPELGVGECPPPPPEGGGGTGPPSGGGEPAPPPQPPPPPPKPCDVHKSKGKSVFVGLVGEQIYSDTGNYRSCALTAAARTGVRIIRQPMRWWQFEPSRNRWDYSYWDAYMTELAKRRIRVMPILSEVPSHRSSAPKSGAERGFYPPKRRKAMATFAVKMVRRYGPDGRFWRANPKLPKTPIRIWQVWNEPNLPPYWLPRPNAVAYVKLLAVVGRAIKRVDPKAEIVSGGFPDSKMKGAVPQMTFLRQMYRAGAKRHFDTLAIHSYTNTHAQLVRQVRGVRREMRRRRDRSPLWITEIGWASGGPDKRFTEGRRGQARRIHRTFRFAARNRRSLGIRGIVYFMWQDADPIPGYRDYWGLHTGLLTKDGKQKPAHAAYRRHARKLRNVR